jgi:hypothetical protein
VKSEGFDGDGDSVNSRYGPSLHSCYATQYCDNPSCWNEAHTVVDDTHLCRHCFKNHLGVSS